MKWKDPSRKPLAAFQLLIHSVQLFCVQVFIPYRNSKLTRILQVSLNFQLLEFLWGLSLVSKKKVFVRNCGWGVFGRECLDHNDGRMLGSRALVAQLVTPDFCFHCLHQTWWYGISRLPCPLRRQTQMRVCQLWIMQSRGSKFQSGKFFTRHRSAFVIVIVVRCQISMWGVQRRSKPGTESFAELMGHRTWWKDRLRASNESRSSKTSPESVARRMRMSLEGSFLCKVFALDLECMFHKQILRPRSSR